MRIVFDLKPNPLGFKALREFSGALSPCYNTDRSSTRSPPNANRARPDMRVFGSFRLDTVNHCLWRANERAPLTPKAFDVLRYLVEHADRLVTQDELLEALWPEAYVNPEGIRKYILEIRKALEDDPG